MHQGLTLFAFKALRRSTLLFKFLASRIFRFQYQYDFQEPIIWRNILSNKLFKKNQELNQISLPGTAEEVKNFKLFKDYKSSKGNFFVDINKNVVLDLDCQEGLLPTGYNSEEYLEATISRQLDSLIINNSNISILPPRDLSDLLRKSFSPFSPSSLPQICLVNGSQVSSIEMLLLSLIKSKQFQKPKSQLLSFRNYYMNHELDNICKRLSKFQKIELKLIDLPEILKPESSNFEYNSKIELQQIKNISRCFDQGEVLGVIVEPVPIRDYYSVSHKFYQHLQTLTKMNSANLIIDESFTCAGITGKKWGYENWLFDEDPDFIFFGKRAGISGFFAPKNYSIPREIQDIFGFPDTIEIIKFGKLFHSLMQRRNIDKVINTGNYIKIMLNQIQEKSNTICNIRGKGLMLAFDINENFANIKEMRDYLLRNGILVKDNNKRTFKLTPSIALEPIQAKYFIKALSSYEKGLLYVPEENIKERLIVNS